VKNDTIGEGILAALAGALLGGALNITILAFLYGWPVMALLQKEKNHEPKTTA
jgi:hypothetical protein